MKYAVFLDIDGTLMSGGVVPAVNGDAIRRAQARGHKIFLNTGRSLCYIPQYILDAAKPDGIVGGLGAAILYNGEIVYSAPVPQKDIETMWENLMHYTCVFEGEEHIFCTPDKVESAQQIGDCPAYAVRNASELVGHKISKITFNGQVAAADREIFSRFCMLYQHEDYAEMSIHGTGKAAAMRRMVEMLGTEEFLCMAMGDSSNDADMLEAADVSVAMGNAIGEIKAICDYVSCDAADGGVAKALEHFGLA